MCYLKSGGWMQGPSMRRGCRSQARVFSDLLSVVAYLKLGLPPLAGVDARVLLPLLLRMPTTDMVRGSKAPPAAPPSAPAPHPPAAARVVTASAPRPCLTTSCSLSSSSLHTHSLDSSPPLESDASRLLLPSLSLLTSTARRAALVLAAVVVAATPLFA